MEQRPDPRDGILPMPIFRSRRFALVAGSYTPEKAHLFALGFRRGLLPPAGSSEVPTKSSGSSSTGV